jgi:hypothetical protein
VTAELGAETVHRHHVAVRARLRRGCDRLAAELIALLPGCRSPCPTAQGL